MPFFKDQTELLDDPLEDNARHSQQQSQKDLQAQVDTLLTDKIKTILYYEYHKLLKDPKVMEHVAHTLHDQYRKSHGQILQLNDLMKTLSDADKDIFIKFREGRMTYD